MITISIYSNIVNNQKDFFKGGLTKNYNFRINALKKLKESIIKYEEDISKSLLLDLGKSSNESYLTEIGMVLSELNFHIKKLKNMMKIKKVKTPLFLFPAKSYIYPEPYGSVLIISPWNYPFLLSINPLIGAISAGNTVIIKPSEYSINTSNLLEQIIKETFDDSYITVVQGAVEETDQLLKQKFDYIFFTGSPKVGKIIMAKASKNLTPVTLELGGKSPAVITKDANLKLSTKRIAFGKTVNAGQTCIAPDYLLIEESLADDFIVEYKNNINEFYNSDPLNNNNYPKIINNDHFERLLDLIKDENVIYGGNYNKDNKIEPTLILIDNKSTKLMQEEIFGPILPIITFKEMDEVYTYINNKEKPLAAYIFTNNKKIQKNFVENISAGGIVINDTIMHFANNKLPFGGVGNSGMGKYHGKESFKTFSHYKSILNRKTWLDLKIRYQPISNNDMKVIKKFLK